MELHLVLKVVLSASVIFAFFHFKINKIVTRILFDKSRTENNFVNNGIMTTGQNGDNFIRNEAPKPEMRVINKTTRVDSEGESHTSFTVEIEAPYPPASLFLKVTGRNIGNPSVIPQRTGGFSLGHTGYKDDYWFTTIVSPYGRYQIDITSNGDTPKIEGIFE